MRQAATVGLVEDHDFEIPHPSSQDCQGLALEMMHEQIRYQDATVRRRRLLEQIALMPNDVRSGKFRSRRKIVSRYRSVRENPRQPMTQFAISCTDLHDAPAGHFGKPPDFPANPSLVSHEKIDSPQIPAAPQRLRIVGRQVIQQLGGDNTFDHWCRLNDWF